MAVTDAQIAQLRRMIDEVTADPYDDITLKAYIEKYPMMDERGVEPYYWQDTTTIPVKVANINWIETYNLNMAAAEIWQEKAASLQHEIDFSADGGSYSRSQAYTQAVTMAKFYGARGGMGTITQVKFPPEPDYPANKNWIGNLPEKRD